MRKIVISLLVICGICGLILGAKGCPNRNKNTKAGSSSVNYNTFTINAPSDLSATVVSQYQVDLVWQDNSNNEDGFEIERSDAGAVYAVLVTTTNNNYSDTGPFTVFTNYTYRVRALNTTGDRSTWSNEVSTTPAVNLGWIAAVAGERHTLALTNSGTLWSWGDNTSGQLGLSAAPASSTLPAQVGFDTDWSRIGTGFWHSFGIKNSNTLWAWGFNSDGQLGIGITEDMIEPIQVGTQSDWSIVTGSMAHSLAIKTNNTIWSWGLNDDAMLGLGNKGPGTDRYTPTQIGTQSDWSSIAAGIYFSFAIKTNNTMWSWGYDNNTVGTLGLGFGVYEALVPTQVGTSSDWANVSAGYWHGLACKTSGTIWGWGYLWDSGSTTDISQIGTDIDWSNKIDAGGFDQPGISPGFNILIKSSNTIWVKGNNRFNQLGLGDTLSRENNPVQIGTTSDWFSVSAGGRHAVAIKSDSTMHLWGENIYGQLGMGDIITRTIPCSLGSPTPPTALTATLISVSEVSISWTDQSNNEVGFIIERKIGLSQPWIQIGTTSSNINTYNDSVPFGATTYYYMAKSFNMLGSSSPSNTAYITTPSNINLTLDSGNGADGAGTVSASGTNINTSSICGRPTADAIAFVATGAITAGATSVNVTATPNGLAIGDEVIIINLQGAITAFDYTGLYEFQRISSINGTTINLNSALNNNYGDTADGQKIMVQRVPNYTSVTVNNGASLTISAWNGITGGVLAFRASGTVTVNAANGINVNAKGFRGGAGADYLSNAQGGESYCGRAGSGGIYNTDGVVGEGGGGGGGADDITSYEGATGQAGSGGGGGGAAYDTSGINFWAVGAGGGGGGNGSPGNGGDGANPGEVTKGGNGANAGWIEGGSGGGGSNDGRVADGAGSATLNQRAYLGGGGGAGGGANDGQGNIENGASGGNGAGIIFISANVITISASSSIAANGENGYTPTFPGGSGGGGAGGSVIILADSITNTGNINANKGVKPFSWTSGDGGDGRVYARYNSISGNTPSPNYSGGTFP